MGRIIYSTAFVVLMSAITAFGAQSDYSAGWAAGDAFRSSEEISTPDALVVSLPIDFPPIMFLNAEGRPVGMLADIWKLWAQKAGKKIEFLPADTWEASIFNIKNGRADIHAGLFYNPDQYKGMAFSQIFYESDIGLFFPVSRGGRQDIERLSGETLGAVRGTNQEAYLESAHPDIRVKAFDTREEMIYAARNGEIRGFISILPLGASYLNRLGVSGEFETSEKALYSGGFCAGVLEGNTELQNLIDKGFDNIANAELAEIEKRWIPDPKQRYFRPDAVRIRLTESERAWIKNHPVIRVFMPSDCCQPHILTESGELEGILVDYLRRISDRTGIAFTFVSGLPPQMDVQIKRGEVDMFPSFKIPDRDAYVNLTRPLMGYKTVIVTRSDAPFISGLGALRNHKIAVIRGAKVLNQILAGYPEIAQYEVNTAREAFQAVSEYKADATIIGVLAAAYLIQRYGLTDLKMSGPTDMVDPQIVFSVRKDFPELIGILNKGISSIDKKEVDALVQKWFKIQIEHRPNWSAVLKWAALVAGVFVIILGMTLYWTKRLTEEVAERKLAEDALRETDAKNRAILSAMPDMMLIQDRQGVFLEAHAPSDKDFYLPPAEFIGKSAAEVLPEDLAELSRNGIDSVFEGGETIIREYQVMMRGVLQHYEARMTSCTAETALCIIRNITDRKMAENDLHKARAAAEAANQAKSVFLASMSHELRSPLNGVLGFAQILRHEPGLTDKMQSGLKIIEESGNHLLSLLNDILDLAKIESGKMELAPTEFSLARFIEGVCANIRIRTEKKGLRFNFEYGVKTGEDQLPEFVRADEVRLRQILINLLGNAVKFTEQGEVVFRVKGRQSEHGNYLICFEIEDTGVGIAAADAQKIFEPFHQAGEWKYRAEGTGLGLSITRRLVEQMGGELHVRSQPGAGSVFGFELTLAEARNAIKRQVVQRKVIGVKGRRLNLLVVDDKPANRAVFKQLLVPLGFHVREAGGALEGLEAAETHKPDAVITDLIMPETDGIEFIRRLRRRPELKACVILASSASVYPEDRKNSMDAGADGFIPKPVDVAQVLSLLEQTLNVEWMHASISAVVSDENQREFALPSMETLRELNAIARQGAVFKLNEALSELVASDEKFRPFADKLGALSDQFLLRDMWELLETYMGNQADR